MAVVVIIAAILVTMAVSYVMPPPCEPDLPADLLDGRLRDVADHGADTRRSELTILFIAVQLVIVGIQGAIDLYFS